jgi:hypothetical protein
VFSKLLEKYSSLHIYYIAKKSLASLKMSIGFVKRVWILRVCLIQVFLVEIVRKSAGFLTAEDILDIEYWNYVRKGREGMLVK